MDDRGGGGLFASLPTSLPATWMQSTGGATGRNGRAYHSLYGDTLRNVIRRVPLAGPAV